MVFTIKYLKQTMFLGYAVLQLFCVNRLCYMSCYFAREMFCTFTLALVGRVAQSEYGLDGPGFESRWGARFSAPVQTGPGDHPASCTTGTGSFPGVESGRGVTLTPHPFLVPRFKNRADLYLYSP
jgi:hypothetical protein